MKKIISFIAIISLLFTSCSDWLDVNTDPNVPTDVNTDLILPAAQASIAVRYGGTLYNIGGIFSQYWTQAPEANQYNDETTYDLRTDYLDDDYTEFFAGGLNDLERIRVKATEDEDWGNFLAATVLRAFIFQVWVDMVDKSPYSEALKGTESPTPAWENGDEVYAGLISEIDAALSKLDATSAVAGSDLMLDGDLDQWIGFANALKLKLLMRQSFVSDVSSAVNALISANNFMTVDVGFDAFVDEVNKRNPWFETTKQLNTDRNHVATVNIIRFMSVKTDPRMAVIFDPAETPGIHEGFYPALKEVELGYLTTDFSRPSLDAVHPVSFMSLAELHLFIAEAELRFNNDKVAAKAAYEKAIDAGISYWGLDPAAYDLYSAGKPYFFDVNEPDDLLWEQIMMQKWASLCAVNNVEAWCELRRTHIPKYFGDRDAFGDGSTYIPGQYLDPAKNLLPDGFHFPNRLPYPDVAVSRNSNTPKLSGTVGFTDPIWWDNN